MSRLSTVALATFAAAALAVPLTAGPTAGAEPTAAPIEEYVALGDSWSADVVLADTNGLPDSTHAPVDCAQSHTNYPKLLAKELGVTNFRDATCGSAKTDDFYAPQEDLPLGGTNAAQFDRLTATTDLVTVGIGGNDAGIAGAAMDCLGALPDNETVPPGTDPTGSVPMGGCKDKYAPDGGEDRLATQIAASEPKLVAALEEIHRRSPEARVLMVDYLAAVPEHACYPLVPISEEDMVYLHATFLKLNAMVQRAAAGRWCRVRRHLHPDARPRRLPGPDRAVRRGLRPVGQRPRRRCPRAPQLRRCRCPVPRGARAGQRRLSPNP